jgi:uncharacterized coiled-coil protein SlyX
VLTLYNNFGVFNTAIGYSALFSNGNGNGNTAIGYQALHSNDYEGANTAIGYQALFKNTGTPGSGFSNTATGSQALFNNTTGDSNTANGEWALRNNTIGGGNVANGFGALQNNTTGFGNIALGNDAGDNLTTGNYNIDIGNEGVAGDAFTIRIGLQGFHAATYIASISGVAVAGDPVVVNSSGQLGVGMPSSKRFKDEIKPMADASDAILALKPVTFRYKNNLDPKRITRFGLVAEEVEKVNPDLVARDAKGELYTVRYEAVNAMLLNEFLKEHRKVEEQSGKIQQQEATITELKSTVAQQQKGWQAVTARLDEQAAQIQKVSARLEASKPAPQVVNNNQ